jgi:ABC-type sugar transport system ATPase subunit
MIQFMDATIVNGAFVLAGVSLHLPAASYGILMGPSGAGKSTLLEALCGLKPVAAGRILLEGRDVTALRPCDRGIGYVPQDGVLFPSMSVAEHLAFPLRIRRRPPTEIARRVEELAAELGLTRLLARHPAGLSGGEAQRVALGRAMAFAPRVLCLDEPLGALDRSSREELISLLHRVHQDHGITVLHSTHSLEEAAKLGQYVLQLDRGVIIQGGGVVGR